MEQADYVVVGGGSAGCVLAERLSRERGAQVVLLEAGGRDRDPRIDVPGLVGLLWRSRHDWTFFTEPQAYALSRRMHIPRGKVLGGSSSLNYMIYMRGNPANYDAWARAGNTGWSYADVLPYFKRSEDNARGADEFHDVGGRLHVADVPEHPMLRRLIEATMDALGVSYNPDFNGARQEGVGPHQATIRGGRRHSAARAFLEPAEGRTNLRVVTGAHASSLIVERGRVVGVRYRVGDESRSVRAAREVVLAAGAIGSPQLLLLSGIGPAVALERLGIPVVMDLPGVGENLQDHVMVTVAAAERGGLTQHINPVAMLGWLAEHTLTTGGPLARNVAEAGAFVRSTPDQPIPDLQLIFLPAGSARVNFDRLPFVPWGHAFSILPTLLYPKSRGRVTLRDADPRSAPCIDPRYFAEDHDLDTLVRGVRLAQSVLKSARLDGVRGRPLTPLASATDEATLRHEVRRRANTLFHPVGTCRMGSDAAAVVDARLRVHGLAGLRVADCSIMPDIVGGNTNAPALMIAERAADFMLGVEAERSQAVPTALRSHG